MARRLILPLALLLAWASAGLAQPTEITSGDWTYTLNQSNEATITAYSGVGGAVVIPATIDGYAVKVVGADWPPIFGEGNSTVTSVTIPDIVTGIKSYAFYECTSLTSVTIGSGVAGIGGNAFNYCSSLTSVSFIGNAPDDPGNVFYEISPVGTVYYLEGTTGWGGDV